MATFHGYHLCGGSLANQWLSIIIVSSVIFLMFSYFIITFFINSRIVTINFVSLLTHLCHVPAPTRPLPLPFLQWGSHSWTYISSSDKGKRGWQQKKSSQPLSSRWPEKIFGPRGSHLRPVWNHSRETSYPTPLPNLEAPGNAGCLAHSPLPNCTRHGWRCNVPSVKGTSCRTHVHMLFFGCWFGDTLEREIERLLYSELRYHFFFFHRYA